MHHCHFCSPNETYFLFFFTILTEFSCYFWLITEHVKSYSTGFLWHYITSMFGNPCSIFSFLNSDKHFIRIYQIYLFVKGENIFI